MLQWASFAAKAAPALHEQNLRSNVTAMVYDCRAQRFIFVDMTAHVDIHEACCERVDARARMRTRFDNLWLPAVR